jgi:hypothetical protein
MSESAEIQAVLAEYRRRQYPDWTNTAVTAVTPYAGGGSLAVVTADDEEDDEVEEVCFIDGRGRVRIFQTSTELITYLETATSYRSWIFTGQGISAIAFLITLIAVIGLAIAPHPNGVASDTLKQVLVLAAGFFFGNQAHRR